ncbi:MAG: Rdx family protein [Alphaproteobacteria bacterium]|nr:Rdx family protein [Alphaproteobacteria bacterium]
MAPLGVEVDITPGRTGSFEVTRDGDVLHSKLETGQFPTEGEVREFAAG